MKTRHAVPHEDGKEAGDEVGRRAKRARACLHPGAAAALPTAPGSLAAPRALATGWQRGRFSAAGATGNRRGAPFVWPPVRAAHGPPRWRHDAGVTRGAAPQRSTTTPRSPGSCTRRAPARAIGRRRHGRATTTRSPPATPPRPWPALPPPHPAPDWRGRHVAPPHTALHPPLQEQEHARGRARASGGHQYPHADGDLAHERPRRAAAPTKVPAAPPSPRRHRPAPCGRAARQACRSALPRGCWLPVCR